jgi:hypothetical protein
MTSRQLTFLNNWTWFGHCAHRFIPNYRIESYYKSSFPKCLRFQITIQIYLFFRFLTTEFQRNMICQYIVKWGGKLINNCQYVRIRKVSHSRLQITVPIFAQRAKYLTIVSQITSWSLRGVNVLSAVRGECKACWWTEDFLLVSDNLT